MAYSYKCTIQCDVMHDGDSEDLNILIGQSQSSSIFNICIWKLEIVFHPNLPSYSFRFQFQIIILVNFNFESPNFDFLIMALISGLTIVDLWNPR